MLIYLVKYIKMDYLNLIGFIVNISSLVILLYQIYQKIVDDCKYNKHELSDTQKLDIIDENIKKIYDNIMRRNSNDN
jgi:hypothetical protein